MGDQLIFDRDYRPGLEKGLQEKPGFENDSKNNKMRSMAIAFRDILDPYPKIWVWGSRYRISLNQRLN